MASVRIYGYMINLVIVIFMTDTVFCSTKCYKAQELGEAEENIYFCYDKKKPDCCQQNSQFTCCESQSNKNMREQIQIWGTVGALVLIIGFLFVCCKNDYNLCSDDRTLAERIGINKVSTEVPASQINQPQAPVRPFSDNPYRYDYSDLYERLPPLPAPTPVPHKTNCKKSGSDVYSNLDTSNDHKGKLNNAYIHDDEYGY